MATIKLSLLLLACYVLTDSVKAMSAGPPSSACVTRLEPIHLSDLGIAYLSQPAASSPVMLESVPSMYEQGNIIEFTITSPSGFFRGFMIQAWPSVEEGEADPFGIFIAQDDGKQRTMACDAPDDTLSHMNANNVSSVIVQWRADSIDGSINTFNFYYSIVQNQSTFWVRLSSSAIEIFRPTTPPPEGSISYPLVKTHGAVMIAAWGLLAPVGILLAIFYKVVWPSGEWFYSHIGIMVGTLVLTILGIVVIVVHAEGQWLTTTSANVPHQVMGIIVCLAVAVNPILAIFRCDPNNEWRSVFNWTHGIIGLVAGEGLALATMLLGLHAFQELPGVYRERVHVAIYMMSGVVGVFIMVLASYNLYAIMFKKYMFQEPDDLKTTSSVPGNIPDQTFYSQPTEEDDTEPSRDYPLRAGFGMGIIVALVILVLATIGLIAAA